MDGTASLIYLLAAKEAQSKTKKVMPPEMEASLTVMAELFVAIQQRKILHWFLQGMNLPKVVNSLIKHCNNKK
jgi:hypothetical protein